MATLTISTTGIAPNAAGYPADCHPVGTIELRRYFEPNAEVAIIGLDADQALGIAYDLLYQAVDAGKIAGWKVSFPEDRVVEPVNRG